MQKVIEMQLYNGESGQGILDYLADLVSDAYTPPEPDEAGQKVRITMTIDDLSKEGGV